MHARYFGSARDTSRVKNFLTTVIRTGIGAKHIAASFCNLFVGVNINGFWRKVAWHARICAGFIKEIVVLPKFGACGLL